MIDRKGLRIVLSFTALMLALAAWRVWLLDDPMLLPRFRSSGEPLKPVNSLVLLVGPVSYLFTYACTTLTMLVVRKGPEKNMQALHRKYAFLGIGTGVALVSMQIYVIARSFGVDAPIYGTAFIRFQMVFMGLVVIAFGNALPKLPRLRSRIRILDFDPETREKVRRLNGYACVASGVALVAVGLLTPDTLMGRGIIAASILTVLLSFSVPVWGMYRHRQSLQ